MVIQSIPAKVHADLDVNDGFACGKGGHQTFRKVVSYLQRPSRLEFLHDETFHLFVVDVYRGSHRVENQLDTVVDVGVHFTLGKEIDGYGDRRIDREVVLGKLVTRSFAYFVPPCIPRRGPRLLANGHAGYDEFQGKVQNQDSTTIRPIAAAPASGGTVR